METVAKDAVEVQQKTSTEVHKIQARRKQKEHSQFTSKPSS